MAKLNINGKLRDVQVEADTPLLWAIREQAGLTGTKYGCGVAQCGACSVHINGELKQEKDAANGDTVLRAERYFGKMQRAFSLGHEVDQANATAKYTDGVLQLTLPKKIAAAQKKLAVH